MCEALRTSHYHHRWLQQQRKGVISKVQMRRGGRCGCRSSRDRGGGDIVTRHKKGESVSGIVVTVFERRNCVCSETHSNAVVSLVVKPSSSTSPHQGEAKHNQSSAIRGTPVRIIEENVSRTVSLLMHRDILVSVQNQSMWPSKWD